MAHEFRLPDIGEGLTEAEIVRWHVPVGGEIGIDETVVEVETDKAVVEIPSPYRGVVLHHGGVEGEIVAVGEILVVVGEPGEVWPEPGSPTPQPTSEAAPIVGTISSDALDLSTPSPTRALDRPGSVLALPVVRKLARDLGVDLVGLEGSGPGGRITRDDVMSAASATTTDTTEGTTQVARAGTTAGTTAGPAPAVSSSDSERRPLSRLRKTIAANMSRSWSEIPHVTTFEQVDASRLLAVRSALADRHGIPIPVDALLVAAVVPALKAFTDFNATLDGDDLVIHRRFDVGVAVDTPDGLMVAVIDGADRAALLELAAEVSRLRESALQRTLSPSELSGQTFTVSNIGAVGGGMGTPIVPYGTTGILSVGRARDSAVVRSGRVEIAPMMPLSLSYDHRVIDGAAGRRFMAMVAENLAEPALFLA